MEINDELLTPISESEPTGQDLRMAPGDLTFTNINECMREEDLTVDGEAKTADWKGVIQGCESALLERTKDLELAGFLMLGWVHTKGFEGLSQGLNLLHRFIETFWDKLYPGYDAEDDEIILGIRARPLSWIGYSDQYVMNVKQVPVTDGIGGGRPLNWFDYQETERVDNAQRMSDQTLYNELKEQDKKTSEEWLAALNATNPDKRSQTVDLLRTCSDQLRSLDELCAEKFEDEAPNFMKLSGLLDEMLEYLSRGVAGAEPGETEEDSVEEGDIAAPAEEGQPAAAAPAKSAGPIASRADAIRSLREIAGFLRRSEPLNPISFLVERAARWGDMSFEEVIKEIVKNEDGLSQVWETLGIVPPSDDEYGDESDG